MVQILQRPVKLFQQSQSRGKSSSSSSAGAKLMGSIFMGIIYGAVAFLLFHWHWLLRNNSNNDNSTAAIPPPAVRSSGNHPPKAAAASTQRRRPAPQRQADLQAREAAFWRDQVFPRTMNHTDVLSSRPAKPLVVAYAISVIKCGDFQTTATGLIDAALVLRHSIHQTSSRAGVSQYDYKMYAFVHQTAVKCTRVLEDLGFEVVVRNQPVGWREISDEYLRSNIGKEWCCGAKEFIKLYAFTLGEPLVVHLDIDFVMHKPMDTLFDVLLYDKDSDIGRTARAQLEVERRQSADEVVPLPDKPQAAFTLDWGQVVPGHRPLFQAGFLVARTNPQVTLDVANIVRTEKYVDLKGAKGGWGGLGYGSYVGAMAMQGVMAFYYGEHVPGEWIELNQCVYNHMGMEVRMMGEPNWVKKKKGQCRNNSPYCEDCKSTPADQIYNIHYTQCRKPWLCVDKGNSGIPRIVYQRTRMDKLLIPVESVNVPHCMEIAQIWHNHRSDLENKLAKLTGDETVAWGRNGTHNENVFHGHCSEIGPGGYLPVRAKPESLLRLKEIYGN